MENKELVALRSKTKGYEEAVEMLKEVLHV